MNKGTPNEKIVIIMLCTNIEYPTNGTYRKFVFSEKKCPAITKKIAHTRIKSKPQMRCVGHPLISLLFIV